METDERFRSNMGKMETSFLNFKAQYPDWDPPLEGSAYYSKAMDLQKKMIEESTIHHSNHGVRGSLLKFIQDGL